ncbi:MAG: hypothetical protein EA382_03045 [Spirochaetaceae bacterium]|nr:MAG: hypothetical protein EA382_03045 [Spirochaetaceae bacterium]
MKTLIAYGTRKGASRRTAELIGETLTKADGRSCIVKDAKRVGRAELEGADSIVVGSSIAVGRWKPSAKRLLGKAASTGKPVAVFVSAAGVLSGKEPGSPDAEPKGTLAEREAEAVGRYIDPVVAKAGARPVATAAFGGRMEMFGKVIFDNWDPEPITAWATDIAGKLR